jgi:hypothetical protein
LALVFFQQFLSVHLADSLILGPKLCLGPQVLEALLRPSRFASKAISAPIRRYLDHPLLPSIVSRAGISPRERIINIAPLERIVVHVLELLPHHVSALDFLGVAPHLPQLIVGFGFVRQLVKAKLFSNVLRIAAPAGR